MNNKDLLTPRLSIKSTFQMCFSGKSNGSKSKFSLVDRSFDSKLNDKSPLKRRNLGDFLALIDNDDELCPRPGLHQPLTSISAAGSFKLVPLNQPDDMSVPTTNFESHQKS